MASRNYGYEEYNSPKLDRWIEQTYDEGPEIDRLESSVRQYAKEFREDKSLTKGAQDKLAAILKKLQEIYPDSPKIEVAKKVLAKARGEWQESEEKSINTITNSIDQIVQQGNKVEEAKSKELQQLEKLLEGVKKELAKEGLNWQARQNLVIKQKQYLESIKQLNKDVAKKITKDTNEIVQAINEVKVETKEDVAQIQQIANTAIEQINEVPTKKRRGRPKLSDAEKAARKAARELQKATKNKAAEVKNTENNVFSEGRFSVNEEYVPQNKPVKPAQLEKIDINKKKSEPAQQKPVKKQTKRATKASTAKMQQLKAISKNNQKSHVESEAKRALKTLAIKFHDVKDCSDEYSSEIDIANGDWVVWVDVDMSDPYSAQFEQEQKSLSISKNDISVINNSYQYVGE